MCRNRSMYCLLAQLHRLSRLVKTVAHFRNVALAVLNKYQFCVRLCFESNFNVYYIECECQYYYTPTGSIVLASQANRPGQFFFKLLQPLQRKSFNGQHLYSATLNLFLSSFCHLIYQMTNKCSNGVIVVELIYVADVCFLI